MAKGYEPLHISGPREGLVQQQEDFLLPNDAYPQLINAFVWRGKILRKTGAQIIGRFRRKLLSQSLGMTTVGGTFTGNIKSLLSLEGNSSIEAKSVVITIGASTYTDNGDGTLSPNGSINYATGEISFASAPVSTAVTANINYFPTLPAMGLRLRELSSINAEETVGFDTKYAYVFSSGGWQEFIPGTVWAGTDSDFFWTANYWTDTAASPSAPKLFWATNNVPNVSNPIRYTNGTTWTSFSPALDSTGTPALLLQALIIIPFRSRLVVFNTFEGTAYNTAFPYPQRIRWANIGSPLTSDAWFDDVAGKGGFLDIPTAQDIIAVGFVRDNLVIYCERSTWQLRYTGKSISPFVVEKINTELGAASTFSAIPFDTNLTGIGDKGIVECDSFESVRIDPKIPDFVFQINNTNSGPQRVQGVRDFVQKLAYWNYPSSRDGYASNTFPNYRLCYNYEEKNWAIFKDSYTVMGPYQPVDSPNWQDVNEAWEDIDYTWVQNPKLLPSVAAGNQQGYVMLLTNIEDQMTTNDPSLSIQDISGMQVIKSIDHNFMGGEIIELTGNTAGNANLLTPDGIGAVYRVIDKDTFSFARYSASTDAFTDLQNQTADPYLGNWQITIRDNFSILSKRFNRLDEGQNIQLGFVDALFPTTSAGMVTMNVYMDYNFSSPVNQYPQNNIPGSGLPDTFFNSAVPTYQERGIPSQKAYHRVSCNVRGNFFAIEWTMSNSQMASNAQEEPFQIDSQILWTRAAGKLLPNF